MPGGRDIRVTEDNKLGYVELMSNWRIDRGVSDQRKSIFKGFYEVSYSNSPGLWPQKLKWLPVLQENGHVILYFIFYFTPKPISHCNACFSVLLTFQTKCHFLKLYPATLSCGFCCCVVGCVMEIWRWKNYRWHRLLERR